MRGGRAAPRFQQRVGERDAEELWGSDSGSQRAPIQHRGVLCVWRRNLGKRAFAGAPVRLVSSVCCTCAQPI